jgi:hypothetical protein
LFLAEEKKVEEKKPEEKKQPEEKKKPTAKTQVPPPKVLLFLVL